MFFNRSKSKKHVIVENAWDNPAASFFEFSDDQGQAFTQLEVDDEGYVRLGDLTQAILRQQVQYISFHFDGTSEYPILTDGLKVKGLTSVSYHDYAIHLDDAKTFIARLRAYRASKGR